ncbi:MAG: hypothetical protein IPM63_03350 [Acidobacteriota bacterium]|nr:MAG: hypothetical protein IPM63_03350 [Acidobacteriota bacterium]
MCKSKGTSGALKSENPLTEEHRKDEMLCAQFDSRLQALCFLALVVFVVGLPVLITESSLVSRRHSYEIMPENLGAFSFVREEIFENDEDIDLLFVGSSVIFGSVDAPQVQKALTKMIGRPARVMTFGHYFNSIDVGYMQIRDLLERKRVRLIVISIPRIPYTDGPSPAACKFIRYSDDEELFAELPLESKITLYACSLLMSPHDLLTMVRPNLTKPSPFAENLGADKAKIGRGRDPLKYVEYHPPSPVIHTRDLIHSYRDQQVIDFSNSELTPYQGIYLHSLIELLKRENVPVVVLNIPQYTERHKVRIVELKDWKTYFTKDVPIVGIPPRILFAEMSEANIAKLFYDEIHLNFNGNEYFTRSILPGILEVYEQNARRDF